MCPHSAASTAIETCRCEKFDYDVSVLLPARPSVRSESGGAGGEGGEESLRPAPRASWRKIDLLRGKQWSCFSKNLKFLVIDLRQKFFRLRFYLDHAFGHAPGSIKCHQKTTQAYKLIFGCKKKEKVLKKNQASFWLKIDNFKQKSCFEVRSHQDFIFKKISVTPLGLLIKLKCCRYACSIKLLFMF